MQAYLPCTLTDTIPLTLPCCTTGVIEVCCIVRSGPGQFLQRILSPCCIHLSRYRKRKVNKERIAFEKHDNNIRYSQLAVGASVLEVKQGYPKVHVDLPLV